MTPREWCLLEEGAADRVEFQERRIAKWISPLLSASAGQVITPAQLLGEEETEHTGKQSSKGALRAAERRYDAMMRKIRKQQKASQ